jgi:hypothetical protein
MRGGALRRAVALAHGWPEPTTGRTHARGKQSQGCGSYGGDGESNERKNKANGVNPNLCASIIGGPLDLPVAAPSAVRCALQWLYPDNFVRKSRRILCQQIKQRPKTLSLGRQP